MMSNLEKYAEENKKAFEDAFKQAKNLHNFFEACSILKIIFGQDIYAKLYLDKICLKICLNDDEHVDYGLFKQFVTLLPDDGKDDIVAALKLLGKELSVSSLEGLIEACHKYELPEPDEDIARVYQEADSKTYGKDYESGTDFIAETILANAELYSKIAK